MLTPELRAAGARQDTARAPELISLEWLQAECEQLERILRLQSEGQLDPRDEQAIARLKPLESTTRALKLWAVLKHLYMRRSEGLVRADDHADEKADVARQLLTREPIEVRLPGGRVVHVTGRSYAAMYHISRHWQRMKLLRLEIDECAVRFSHYERAVKAARWRQRRQLRALAARAQAAYERAYLELLAHRQALYAHALTADGAPARGPADAPDWWVEIDDAADWSILAGLWQAGPGRYFELGEQPKPKDDKTTSPAEDLGYASLLSAFERRQKIEPATYYDRDLPQLLTWMRASAESVPEMEA